MPGGDDRPSRSCRRARSGRAPYGRFLAVSDGPDDILFIETGAVLRMPVFKIGAVDKLGAGDALHGAFALTLAEGADEAEALRFGAAVAGLKCTRIGGAGGDAGPGGRGGLAGRRLVAMAFVRTPEPGAAAHLRSFGRKTAPDGPIFVIATYPLI